MRSRIALAALAAAAPAAAVQRQQPALLRVVRQRQRAPVARAHRVAQQQRAEKQGKPQIRKQQNTTNQQQHPTDDGCIEEWHCSRVDVWCTAQIGAPWHPEQAGLAIGEPKGHHANEPGVDLCQRHFFAVQSLAGHHGDEPVGDTDEGHCHRPGKEA